MTRRRMLSLAFPSEQAQPTLAILIQEGKLAASEVKKALQRRNRLIRTLRDRLAALGEDAGRVGKPLLKGDGSSGGRKVRAAKPRAKRMKPRISAATRKMHQAQGRYMAALRNLSKESRAKVKAIREKSGVNAAIAAARSRLAEQRFITRQPQSKDSDQPWKKNGKHHDYPARFNLKPDKHGGSGAGRQQGGSGVGREHG